MKDSPGEPDARDLAWDVLQRVEAGAYADAVLGSQLARSSLARRDQALAARLVYGTLVWQLYLDHLLTAFSQKPLAKLDAPIRCLLRMALLQICKLDRIPTFAAVDTAVNLSKRHRGGAASGFVNAVLRRASRGWSDVRIPDQDPIAQLSIRQSHPRWLVERWTRSFGLAETEALLAADNEAAPTTVRVNRLRAQVADVQANLAAIGVTAEPCRFSSLGLNLTEAGTLESLPGYAEGHFTPQGEASQLAGMLAAPQPGFTVLDACAAPGGKTTYLAEAMKDQGRVVALDIHARGVGAIQRAATRLGLGIIETRQASAAEWNAKQPFDLVLVDAPCSGLGTLRQHPEIKWRREPNDLVELAQLQSLILSRVAEQVRSGGTLVYSTCTISSEENEEQIDSFLHSHPEFVVEDPRPYLPAAASILCDDHQRVRMFPHRDGLDGFFAVRLRRNP